MPLETKKANKQTNKSYRHHLWKDSSFYPISFPIMLLFIICFLTKIKENKNKERKAIVYFIPCQSLVCSSPLQTWLPICEKRDLHWYNVLWGLATLFYLSLFWFIFPISYNICHIFPGYGFNRLPRFNLCPVGALFCLVLRLTLLFGYLPYVFTIYIIPCSCFLSAYFYMWGLTRAKWTD